MCVCDGRDEGGELWSAWGKVPYDINTRYMMSSKVKTHHRPRGTINSSGA